MQPGTHAVGSRLVPPAGIADVPVHQLQVGGGLLELAILFLILAVVAGFLGARGIAGLSWDIAKWLVIIFVILAIISFIL